MFRTSFKGPQRRACSYALRFFLLFVIVDDHVGAQTNTASPVTLRRTWTDATGLFTLNALLIEVGEERVLLRKDSGTLVQARRQSLSKNDQYFIDALEKSRSPFQPFDRNASESASASEASKVIPSGSSSKTEATDYFSTKVLESRKRVILYTSENPPKDVKTTKVELPSIESGNVFLNKSHIANRISPIILLNAKTGKVAISDCAHSNLGSENVSRVYVGELPNGPFTMVAESKDLLTLLDHNIQTGETLAVCKFAGDHQDRLLVVYQGLADGKLLEKVRFRLPEFNDTLGTVTGGLLLEQNRVVVHMDGVVYCWDISTGNVEYQSDPNANTHEQIAFSPDRRHMALSRPNGYQIVDTTTGRDLGFIAFSLSEKGDACFSPFDNCIAFCRGDSWGTFDFSTNTLQGPHTSTLPLHNQLVAWMDRHMIVGGTGSVIHTSWALPVWQYQGIRKTSSIWKNSVTIVDNRGGLRLKTLPLPHSELNVSIENNPSLTESLIIDTQTSVRLEVEVPNSVPFAISEKEVRERFLKKMKTAGWKSDDASDLRFVVQLTEPSNKSPLVTSFNGPSPDAPPQFATNKRSGASCHCELRKGDEIIWVQHKNLSAGNYSPLFSSRSPSTISIEKVIFDWLDKISLPTRIAKPPFVHGFGASVDGGGSWQETKSLIR